MKLTLNIQSGSLAGKSFDLTTGFLTVGRGENCTVRFDPLQERVASKKHCYIEARPDGFYLVDGQSTNGTWLNGGKIQDIKLNSGDQIQFGRNGVLGTIIISSVPTQNQATELYIRGPADSGEVSGNLGQSQPYYGDSEETRFGNNSEQTRLKYQPPPPPNELQPTQLGVNFPVPPSFEQPPSFQQQPSIQQFSPVSYPQYNPNPNFSTNVRNSFSSLGVGNLNIQPQPAQSKTGRNIGIAATIFVIIFLSIIVALIMFASVGPVAAIKASLVAFVPAMFYLLPLVWLDRYDPEPAWLLALAFAWGALLAVVVSFVVNTALGVIAYIATRDPGIATIVGAVISAPIFEEGSKGLGLILILIFFRRYLDDILDGIIFAGVIALGFATVENVLYYGKVIAIGGGSAGLIILFVVRGIMSPFAHVTFTSMTGIGVGISRESHNTLVKFLLPVLGYFGAVTLHAIWNGMAVVGGLEGFILGYIFLEIPFFLIFVGFSFYVMHRQNKILREMLAIDVARGLVPQEHFNIATSAFRSTGWLLGSIFSGKFSTRSKYLRAIGKLGLSYWHIQRATAAQGQTASFQQNPILREEVLRWRDQV